MMSFASLNLFVACLLAQQTAPVSSFGVVPSTLSPGTHLTSIHVVSRNSVTAIRMSEEMDAEEKETAEKVENIGNLVADDEWMGLNMELSELVRVAILEDVKKKTRDFIGDEEYKVGDITKEIDSRVKDEVAKIRGKDEYELGDLIVAMDDLSKDMTCQLTGKEDYEVGDLTKELDERVKSSVESFCGLEPGEYKAGDLTVEMDKRVRGRVEEFVGKEYEFGDISKEIENRRRDWVKDFLGEEAASKYEFGDITKKTLAGITGKDEYEFGDVTKKIMGDLFGKRKRGGQS
mmetsp:Transcript_28005/g.39446  ORF Transcript_28005/g.39446 Transcript_28005/m.39446 type:complete len:290 (+) Transcript_28005:99-968(+)